MPELPEVETIVRRLQHELAGRVLGKVRLLRTDILHGNPRRFASWLTGKRVERVHRRAKRAILEFSPSGRVVFHLGMTGRLLLTEADAPLEKHTHLTLGFASTRRELRFLDPRRFGGVWLFVGAETPVGPRLGEVGPEPLTLTSKAFRGVLAHGRQIKALLMDQRAIAGLGNIYCDESLHAAGIHPLTPADTLDAVHAERLLVAIKTTLRQAIRHEGSTYMDYRTVDGREGSFQRFHRVYQREDLPCRTCGAAIVCLRVAGRSTFICPSCQPKPNRPNIQTS